MTTVDIEAEIIWLESSHELEVGHTTVSRRISRHELPPGARLFSRTSTGWKLMPIPSIEDLAAPRLTNAGGSSAV